MNDEEIAARRGISPDIAYRLRVELGDSPESIAAMPEGALRRAVLKLEYPDRARQRIEHERGALVDDRGEIPEGSLTIAHQQAAELRASEPPGLTCGMPTGGPLPALPPEAALAPLAGFGPAVGWSELGPDNIGGRTRSIVVDPTDPDRLFAGGVGGGVWRSVDGGTSWMPTDDLMGNLAICSLVMDPTDSQRLLAGTGEGYSNADAIRGDGIFETRDGGVTWAALPATAGSEDFHYVNGLALTADGSVLLAATNTGIHRSDDGGATWTATFAGAVGNLVVDPTDDTRAIAGALQGGRALFSDDGGASWAVAVKPTTANRRVQVCYAAADPTVTYASVDATPSQLWRSTDGGRTYVSMAALSNGQPASFLGQQGWYDNAVWAGDPTDRDLVVVGGIDLWRSTDGGDTLTQISTWWSDQSAHADHHAIVSDPGYDGIDNRRVYFGNDGGVWRADDVRSVGSNATPPYDDGWTSLNHGYAVTQFYEGAAHLGTATIVGGTQDNGTLSRTPAGGNHWTKVYGGDGGACASDPRDPQIWYGEYVYLNIFRNGDGASSQLGTQPISGQFWDGFQWRWKPDPFTITDCRHRRAQFIAPFALDPNDGDRLLGGAASLWLTTDPRTPNTFASGPSWRTIKAPIGGFHQHTITAIAVADGHSDVIVVGHANGEIHRTTDGTAAAPTWNRIDTGHDGHGGIGIDRQCLGLAIDPDDRDIVYAAFGGYSADNLWRTADGGRHWENRSAPLPDAPIRAVTLHPQRSAWLYAATEVGVFASEDAGLTWSATNQGPADVASRHLFWLGTELIVATHGRGMFQIDLTIAEAFPPPELVYRGAEELAVDGSALVRHRLEVANAAAYPDSLFRPAPDLPPCGTESASARTWADVFDAATGQRVAGFCTLSSAADLTQLWFSVPAGGDVPDAVHLVLHDRRAGQSYRSNDIDLAPAGDEPEERAITGVDRDGGGRIVRIGGVWGTATVEEAIGDLRANRVAYHVEVEGQRARVSVVNGRTGPYLRSYGDAAIGNNLSELPPIGDGG